MMFFVVLVALFYARQAGTHMDARTLRHIGDWHPVSAAADPVPQYRGAGPQQPDHGNCPRSISFARSMCWKNGWGWASPRCAARRPWLAATLVLGLLFLLGPGDGLEAVDRAGICLRSLGDSGKLLLLHHYRPACRPSGPWHPGLASVVTALGWFKRVESRQIAVDATAWFWHTMGLAWLLLLQC